MYELTLQSKVTLWGQSAFATIAPSWRGRGFGWKTNKERLCRFWEPPVVNTDSQSIGGSEGGEIERMLMQPCAR